MNEIQAARYSSALHKLLGIGEGAPVPTLAPELIATLALEVDRPEWKYLAGERLCAGGGADAAVAGENSHVAMVNPLQSQAIIVIERVIMVPSGATSLYTGQAVRPSGAGTAQLGSGFLDQRWPLGSGVTTGQVWTKTQAGVAVVTTMDRRPAVAGNAERIIDYPIVLPPGGCHMVAAVTVNTTLTVNYIWRERNIEPTEEVK